MKHRRHRALVRDPDGFVRFPVLRGAFPPVREGHRSDEVNFHQRLDQGCGTCELSYTINADAASTARKIDVSRRDAIGREWQLSTSSATLYAAGTLELEIRTGW